MDILQTQAADFRLVGRSRELTALDSLAHSDVLWIWGPPGVGKSRLASEWLRRNETVAVWLDLSTCSSEEELLVQLAEALEVQGRANERLRSQRERLQARTRDSRRLLFLDNADPVRDAVATFLAVEGVKAVVTCRSAPSREEHVAFRLRPLDDDAAMELFTTTALRANPDLARDPKLMVRLLKRLDGLPLALEFAARRTRVLSLEELVARLESGRASTMDGVIQWMWRELPAPLRHVVSQCAVFGDSFTVEAAEAIIRADGASALDLVDELVAAAWLQRSTGPGGGFRFRLLHTLRDFAIAEAPPDELAAARHRALAYWAEVSTAWRSEVEGRHGISALRRLESERENLLEAATAGLAAKDVRALAVLANLRWNACFIGPAFRYEELVATGRELAERCPDDVAARFLDFAASFARASGYGGRAEDDARRASARAASLGDPTLRARTTITLGGILSSRGNDEGLGALTEGLDLARERRSAVDEGRALEQLGFCYLRRFELEQAEQCFRGAIDVFRANASDLFSGDSKNGLGWVLFRRGRARAAVSRFRAALDDAEALGVTVRVAACTFNLAIAEHVAGELRDAARIDTALRMWGELGLDGYLPAGWVASARIYWDLDQPERAVRAARTAERLAPAVRDLHNQGLAAGLVALFAWAKDVVPMDDDMFDTLSAIDVHADPVAATAHLVALVGMRASRSIPALRELNRAEEIAALIPDSDEYVYGVTSRLIGIGHAFAKLCDARLAQSPTDRAAAVGLARRALQALGELPNDPRALRRTEPDFYVRFLYLVAQRELATIDAPDVELPPEFRHEVEFHANCHWVRIDGGAPIDLSSRKQLRVIVKALARQYFANPTVLVSVEELLEVGWPGEAMTPASGRSRIYTAVRDLRKLGLDQIIVTEEGGYRLAPDIRFRVAPHTGILPPSGG